MGHPLPWESAIAAHEGSGRTVKMESRNKHSRFRMIQRTAASSSRPKGRTDDEDDTRRGHLADSRFRMIPLSETAANQPIEDKRVVL
ncbi:hypothetical protein DAPPUDRAFT_253453 [Daphnia pulex]|uniref:Uncharacterized protein n=1 Tax=Daphnia pulex TaxID=6669 RepID=E9H4V5_DAPPU|nr:hypothetical protein DAPPUDRAFT_253453 [Daphnia pulex]|eukprot:EFX73210.1 hypothetical protein DAPPUDRAFT_253453 [Daphnia pulex]